LIKSLIDKKLTVRCENCGKETEYNVMGKMMKFIKEFGEYENFQVQCECGTITIINMNIPVDDVDEDIATGEIPVEEEISRHYIRILQREIREDFIASKKGSP
jgi:hypothetical protein